MTNTVDNFKWDEEAAIDFHNFIFRHKNQYLTMGEYVDQFKQSKSIPNKQDEKTYTQSEVDTIRKETWEAARLHHPIAGMKYTHLCSYLQSLSKPSTTPIEDKVNVLFTTDDGVDIYGGEETWMVDVAYNFLLCKGNWYGKDTRKSLIYFSTKEAAEQYILENKPCLSLNEVYDNILGSKDSYAYEKLHNYTKKKLNQLNKQ